MKDYMKAIIGFGIVGITFGVPAYKNLSAVVRAGNHYESGTLAKRTEYDSITKKEDLDSKRDRGLAEVGITLWSLSLGLDAYLKRKKDI